MSRLVFRFFSKSWHFILIKNPSKKKRQKRLEYESFERNENDASLAQSSLYWSKATFLHFVYTHFSFPPLPSRDLEENIFFPAATTEVFTSTIHTSIKLIAVKEFLVSYATKCHICCIQQPVVDGSLTFHKQEGFKFPSFRFFPALCMKLDKDSRMC